jgi:hypothetical protein
MEKLNFFLTGRSRKKGRIGTALSHTRTMEQEARPMNKWLKSIYFFCSFNTGTGYRYRAVNLMLAQLKVLMLYHKFYNRYKHLQS